MQWSRGLASVTAAVVVAALGACGGSADSKGDYVDALTAASKSVNPSLSDEQNECVADATVDAVGLGELQDAATPDEIEEAQATTPDELGVEVDEEDGQEFYDGLAECTDVRDLVVVWLVGTEDIPADVTECLDAELPDDVVRDVLETTFVQSGEALEADSELVAQLETAFTTCTPTG